MLVKKIASLYNDIGLLKSFFNGDTIMHNIINETIPFEKMGRTLVWHDEFEGEELNADKWRIHQTMNGADRIYTSDKEHIFVKDGCLNLVTDRSGEKEKPFLVPEGVLTHKTMLFKYGYLEMRGKIPFRHGAWPGFWMQSITPFSKAKYLAEIDIFEVFSNDNTLGCALHKWSPTKHTGYPDEAKGEAPCHYTFKNSENLNNEFHTYGLEWDEKHLKFYVDGECYTTMNITDEYDFDKEQLPGMQGFHDFSFVIFNNEIFSSGGGWPVPGWNLTEEDEMPINYVIDYVRLYQKENEEIKFAEEIKSVFGDRNITMEDLENGLDKIKI